LADSTGFRADINGLRAIAMMMVMLFHFQVPGFAGGFVGVDIFFAITGYLMTSIIIDAGRGFSLLAFYRARLLRVLPALTVLVGTLLTLGYVFIEPLAYRTLAIEAGAATLFLSNFVFLTQSSYFHSSAETHWLLHSWTLSVECQFYLLYPLLILGIRRVRPQGKDWLIGVLVAGFMTSLLIAITLASLPGRPANAGFYLLPSRAFEMIAGGLTFFLARSQWGTWLKHRGGPIQAAGLGICLASAFLFDARTAWPSVHALIPVLGACLTILAGRSDGGLLRSVLPQRLGTWSYSIYLWHWPILVLLRETGLDEPAPVIGGMAASVLLGVVSFYWVEQPTRRLQSSGQREWAAGALVGSGGLVLVCSAGIYAANGLPARVDCDQALLRDAMVASQDHAPPEGCKGFARYGLESCAGQLPAANRVAVIGDSHALVWLHRYHEQAGSGAEFFVQYGCPPFPTYVDLTRKNCAQFNQLALERVLTGPYQRVVFIAFWVSYLDGSAAHGCRKSSDGCQPLRNREEEDRLFEDFYAMVAQLIRNGREVVIVQPIPVPFFDVPRAIRIQAFQGRDNPALSGVDLAARSPAENRVRAKLKHTQAYGAIVVDPRDQMCRNGICAVLAENGRSLYSDGNHLRPWVVRERLNFLDAYISDDPRAVSTIRPAPAKPEVAPPRR
jgi:peptidoglycan/LPS O-acetylase OafA/YrhL